MAATLAWRPLPLARSPGVPVLLAFLDVGTADYTLRVTDLANVWAETLERKAICMRGWSENTSIDPSDTPENMAKFLSSLRSALDSSEPGHNQTSLRLSPATAEEVEENGLTLRMTCELPGFQPLKWPMHLKKCPSSAIATDLVLPLIQAQHARDREVESLIQTLKNKDTVITKVLDKLEATGTGLEHVFTALSGRKKVARSAAEDKVKGLAPFSRRKWKASLDDSEDGPNNASDLVEGVFGEGGLRYQNVLEVDRSPELDSWWHDFHATSQAPSQRQIEKTSQQKQQTPDPPAQSINSDDDFQVQLTPPHLTKHAQGGNEPMADDASTEGEDVSPVPDRVPAPTVSETQQPGRTKPAPRLGTIGRKEKPAPSHSPTPKTSQTPQKAAAQTGDDSETASEANDDDATASLPDSSPHRAPPSPKPAPAKKGGLGRIGGQKPRPVAVGKTEADTASDAETADAAARPRKLGVIGKKIGGVTSHAASDVSEGDTHRGRLAARGSEDVKEETRETSQERADRKRQELKRELEKKAAAGPAKKKRKF